MKNGLIIFVRNPLLGKVKTRIAATTGEATALSIYKELLQHTHDIVLPVQADKYVFYSDFAQLGDIWENEYFHKFLQNGKTLGERMQQAFERLFNQSYDKVCIIGSDCFELSSEMVNEAFDQLATNDVVIGPANDGGYYMLGMKANHPFIFEDKKWSTDTVLEQTVEQLKQHQLVYHRLPVLTDIDTEEDWLAAKKNTV